MEIGRYYAPRSATPDQDLIPYGYPDWATPFGPFVEEKEYMDMNDVKGFWETEAAIAYNRRDRILKELEIREIAKHVRDGMRVLDVGCGDGETGLSLTRRFNIRLVGVDFSKRMIDEAIAHRLDSELQGFATFELGDIAQVDISGSFDLVYTQRCLINLRDWPTQMRAIYNILELLKPGGKYLMVEHSQEGRERLNDWRAMVGLDAIPVPSHNRYLRNKEVNTLAAELYGARRRWGEVWPQYFASTYYLLSRVVNAAMARAEGREPDYDAFVNQLALKLPNVGNIGHAAIWVWRKP